MNTCTYKLMLIVAIATLCITQVQGQSYHFSNGWNPGKRSSMQEVCHFRPEVKALIFKLIEDEIKRMMFDQSCYGGMAAFKSLLKKDMPYSTLDDK